MEVCGLGGRMRTAIGHYINIYSGDNATKDDDIKFPCRIDLYVCLQEYIGTVDELQNAESIIREVLKQLSVVPLLNALNSIEIKEAIQETIEERLTTMGIDFSFVVCK